jgi:hypothetical protein
LSKFIVLLNSMDAFSLHDLPTTLAHRLFVRYPRQGPKDLMPLTTTVAG